MIDLRGFTRMSIKDIEYSSLDNGKLNKLKQQPYSFYFRVDKYPLSRFPDSRLAIVVYDNENCIAHSDFHFEEELNYWTPDNVKVEDDFIRQYIGSVMYLLAHKILRKPIIRTHNSSKDALKMWEIIGDCISK